MDYQHVRRHRCQSDWGKVLLRVIGNLWIKTRIDDETGANDRDRVAIRTSPRARTHSKISARTSLVLNIKLLTKLRQLFRDQSRKGIGGPSGRKGYDYTNWPLRIRPRLHGPRKARKCSHTCYLRYKLAT